ncbi:MAG: transposase domain-containing protein [Exilibacterium sp.]
MFSNAPAGARASCALYTLTVTACLNQVDPFAYFRYILAVLPVVKTLEELQSLLPWWVNPDIIKGFDEFRYCRGKQPD